MNREITDYLDAHAIHRNYSPGELIFSQGDKADSFFLLVSGLSLTYTLLEDGRERNILITWPGRVFGASTMFEKVSRRASAIALKKTEALEITYDLYLQCVREFEAFNTELLKEISIDLGVMFEQLVDSSLMGAEVRVARFLCRRLTPQQCELEDGVPKLTYTQDFIASVLGLSRYCVNYSLSCLSEKGMIKTDYGKIYIEDLQGLRSYAYGGENSITSGYMI